MLFADCLIFARYFSGSPPEKSSTDKTFNSQIDTPSAATNGSAEKTFPDSKPDRIELEAKYAAKWLSIYREKRAKKIQDKMMKRGSLWRKLEFQGSIKEHSTRNLARLEKFLSAQPLSASENEFLSKVKAQKLSAVHFTNNDLRDNDDIAKRPGMSVLSRKTLEERGNIAYSSDNTPFKAIEACATDGHVFFSLEPGRITGDPMKKKSRFGRHSYRLDFGHPQFQDSFITLHDMLVAEFPVFKKERFPFLVSTGINRTQFHRDKTNPPGPLVYDPLCALLS